MYYLTPLCSVCLSYVEQFSNIDSKKNNKQLKEKLQFCFPDIEHNYEFQDICSECNERLENLYTFKHLYLNSQMRLKHYLSKFSHGTCGKLSLVLQDISKHDHSSAVNGTNVEMFNSEQICIKNDISCNDQPNLYVKTEKLDFAEPFENEVTDISCFECKTELVRGNCGVNNRNEYNPTLKEECKHNFQHSTELENVNQRNECIESNECILFNKEKKNMLQCNNTERVNSKESFENEVMRNGVKLYDIKRFKRIIQEKLKNRIDSKTSENILSKKNMQIGMLEINKVKTSFEERKTARILSEVAEQEYESSWKNKYEGVFDIECNNLRIGTQTGKGAVTKEDSVNFIEDNETLDYSDVLTDTDDLSISAKDVQYKSSLDNKFKGLDAVKYNSLQVDTKSGESTMKKEEDVYLIEDDEAKNLSNPIIDFEKASVSVIERVVNLRREGQPKLLDDAYIPCLRYSMGVRNKTNNVYSFLSMKEILNSSGLQFLQDLFIF